MIGWSLARRVVLGDGGMIVGAYGDCFGLAERCDAVQIAIQRHAQIGFGLLLANGVAAIAALVLRSRVTSLVVADVAGATAAIGILSWLGPLQDIVGIGPIGMLFGAILLVWGGVADVRDRASA